MNLKYCPRNDFVVVKISIVEVIGKVAVPSTSAEGKKYHVVAVGPKVEHLEVGDRVLMIGDQGENWGYIPGTSDHIVIKEANIVLTIEEERLLQ